MRWNGTDITGVPTFIYHDELIAGTPGANLAPDPDGPGVLSCTSASGTTTVNWNSIDRAIDPTITTGNILLRIGTMRSQLLQNAYNPFPTGGRQETLFNGLWSCMPLNGARLHVGLYFRSSSEF